MVLPTQITQGYINGDLSVITDEQLRQRLYNGFTLTTDEQLGELERDIEFCENDRLYARYSPASGEITVYDVSVAHSIDKLFDLGCPTPRRISDIRVFCWENATSIYDPSTYQTPDINTICYIVEEHCAMLSHFLSFQRVSFLLEF